MTNSQMPISFRYAVFSFVVDEARSQSIPIGVALWSEAQKWAKVRLVQKGERLTGFKQQESFPFVEHVEKQLNSWISTASLPHCTESLELSTDGWWRHVHKLLIHRVRLSEPLPIDCHNPEEELEPLYEAIVAPHRPIREQRTRIDREIRKCLNGLSDRFKSRQRLPGFGGRDVKVLTAYHGAGGWVVIEGVNLASAQAESSMDATVSRLMRLECGARQERCEVMVGYLASPDGLNGEAVLVDWLKASTKAQVFDLVKERDEFHATAHDHVEELDKQGTLLD